MATATLFNGVEQSGFAFPQALSEKYRPSSIAEFVGLEKPRAIMSKFAAHPYESGWVFVGPSGTGKTSLAMAIAAEGSFEVHHIPSQDCNLETIQRVRRTCQYVPMQGKRMHLVLCDEGDQMSTAAQMKLLSYLDGADQAPNTVWIFTCNSLDRFEQRFLSRNRVLEFSSYGIAKDTASLLERIWNTEAPQAASRPNFARIVKDSANNVRESLMNLEIELMAV